MRDQPRRQPTSTGSASISGVRRIASGRSRGHILVGLGQKGPTQTSEQRVTQERRAVLRAARPIAIRLPRSAVANPIRRCLVEEWTARAEGVTAEVEHVVEASGNRVERPPSNLSRAPVVLDEMEDRNRSRVVEPAWMLKRGGSLGSQESDENFSAGVDTTRFSSPRVAVISYWGTTSWPSSRMAVIFA
jgi:hypothetical protein